MSPSSEHRLTNVHNTVKGSCCDVFYCGELVFKAKNIYMTYVLHSLTKNDLELYL